MMQMIPASPPVSRTPISGCLLTRIAARSSSRPHLRLLLLVSLTGALLGCQSEPSSPQRPPNVLLVVIDTLRADAVIGAPVSRAPVISTLAREGSLFTQARSTAPWTVPAHASIFTGLYPSRHSTHNEGRALPRDANTLAEILSATHDTAAFTENPHITRGKQFDQGFSVFKNTWPKRTPGSLRRETTNRLVRDWLTTHPGERPFFVFINFMDPHLPYRPPDRFEKMLSGGAAEASEITRMTSFEASDARQVMARRDQLTEAELAALRRLYAAEVASADSRLGKVIDALRVQDLLDETLVVVVGDHGENIGDHGLMEHQLCLYESLLRVPLLLRLPGTVPAGIRRHDPVQLVDIYPTVLEAVGVPKESWPTYDGESLLGSNMEPDRALVAEYMLPLDQQRIFAREMPEFDFSPFMRRLQSIQIGSRKLILARNEPVELYDLATDPMETENLLERDPETARLLLKELQRWRSARPTLLAAELGRREAETIEALRQLGYVE